MNTRDDLVEEVLTDKEQLRKALVADLESDGEGLLGALLIMFNPLSRSPHDMHVLEVAIEDLAIKYVNTINLPDECDAEYC